MIATKVKQEDGTLTLALTGRIDSGNAAEAERQITEATAGFTGALVVDAAALEYISSAGLRVLLFAQKIMNRQGEMKVAHASDTIREIFEVTGFSEILTIE